MTVKELFTTVGFDAIVKAPYSQVASAKLAICRKETLGYPHYRGDNFSRSPSLQ